MKVDARAWMLWLTAALALVFLVEHPIIHVMVTLSAGAVAATGSNPSPFRGFLLLGLALICLRTVMFALTGHTGDTLLFDLPALHLPKLVGGLTIGGPVTGEVLIASVLEGTKILAVVACFGAFLSVVEIEEVLEVVPGFLFEATLIVSTALAFAPSLARSVRDLREAQRMRGIRSHRAVSVPSLVSPMLTSALERSLTLAESMESRGFGRSALSPTARWRALAAASALVLSASASALAMGRTLAAPVVVMSGGALILSLMRIGRAVSRTRYRRRHFERIDWAISAGSALAFAAAAVQTSEGMTNPYAAFAFTPPALASVAAALGLAVPSIRTFIGRRV